MINTVLHFRFYIQTAVAYNRLVPGVSIRTWTHLKTDFLPFLLTSSLSHTHLQSHVTKTAPYTHTEFKSYKYRTIFFTHSEKFSSISVHQQWDTRKCFLQRHDVRQVNVTALCWTGVKLKTKSMQPNLIERTNNTKSPLFDQ